MGKTKTMMSKSKQRFFTIDTNPDINENSQEKKRKEKNPKFQKELYGPPLKKNKEDIERKERELTDALFGGESTLEADLDVGTSILTDDISYPNPFETQIVERQATSEDEEAALETDSTNGKREPVWEDEDDTNVRVKDVVATFSKARGTRGVRETSDGKYEEVLKTKFTQVYGDTPEWAELGRKVDDEEDVSDMRTRTSVYLSSPGGGAALPKDRLSFKVVANLNKSSYREGGVVTAVDFHPDMSIALVAGYAGNKFGSVTLFQFDGKKNLKIKNILFPKFPIKCAKFLPKSSQFVVSSNLYGRFYVYDIEEGHKYDIPWQHANNRNSLKHFEVSPGGEYVAFLGSGGEINFYQTKTMSFFESLRVPCQANGISFSKDGNILYTCGDNGQVYIFDLMNWECSHSFYDDGCIEGTSIAASQDGRFVACGSSSGIVNLYDASAVASSENPRPLKSFASLVTPVTSLAFNATSEILATASSYKENAFKLIHTRSLTYFANFPGVHDFKKIETVTFSPDSKYLSAGNNHKVACLCRLPFY